MTLFEEVAALLQQQDRSRIPLCTAHTEACRAAMPYPVQGVHWHLFGRPVDTVEDAADCLLCTSHQGTRGSLP